jgi:hypothetical protein
MWQHQRNAAGWCVAGNICSCGITEDVIAKMSLVDWIGVVLMVPFLLAMLTLIVYLTIGFIGSAPRRRRIARDAAARKASVEQAPPRPAPQHQPGD